jgi:hypothetical protein
MLQSDQNAAAKRSIASLAAEAWNFPSAGRALDTGTD